MSVRVEIIPGPGTVARFGDVCVWAGPGASPTLVAFLIDSARNVGTVPQGGARIADHIGGVLAGRDPEPGVAFSAIGPGQQGTVVLLHGAIQAWDGARWLIPQPQPGWLRTEVPGRQTIVVSIHGAPAVAPTPMSDLRAGVVPGAGFCLVPVVDSAPTTMLAAETTSARPAPRSEATVVDATELVDALREIRGGGPPDEEVGPPPASEPPPSTERPSASPPSAEPPSAEPPTVVSPPATEPEPAPTIVSPPEEMPSTPAPATSGGESVGADGGGDRAEAKTEAYRPATSLPAGTIAFEGAGLSSGSGPPAPLSASSVPSRPTPLPPVGQPERPVPGQPVVAGLRCPRDHFNHPAVTTCVTCGRPVDRAQGQVSGSRPALGVLVADNSTVYRLDRSYLIGSAPEADPTVTGGRARPLVLGPGGDLAPVHAEIRLTGWTVSVIDRGSTKPTQILQPGEIEWTPLRPFITNALRPGAHVAVGQRVLSLISPWPINEPIS